MKRLNKRALYESIMLDVAKIVKKHLNEKFQLSLFDTVINDEDKNTKV